MIVRRHFVTERNPGGGKHGIGEIEEDRTRQKKPEIKQNFLLEFTIDNEIQNIELEDERSNLLTFLRVELNNYVIQLKVLVSKEDNSVKHLSSKDKFLKMADKNPALHELRERLNLDIEY